MDKPRNKKQMVQLVIVVSAFVFFGSHQLYAEPPAASQAAKAVESSAKEGNSSSGVLVGKEAVQQMKIEKTMEQVSGEVVSIGLSSLSILYETTADAEYEMILPFAEDFKLSGYKKVSDIKLHDVVDMEYEKVVENADTSEIRISRNIKSVTFVKHAPEEASEEKAASS